MEYLEQSSSFRQFDEKPLSRIQATLSGVTLMWSQVAHPSRKSASHVTVDDGYQRLGMVPRHPTIWYCLFETHSTVSGSMHPASVVMLYSNAENASMLLRGNCQSHPFFSRTSFERMDFCP